jgi:serine/threonine protein kinase
MRNPKLRGARSFEWVKLFDDIFSLGSLLFNLITKRPLFLGNSVLEVLYANKTIHPHHIIAATIPEGLVGQECILLLCWMLETRPELRPTTEDCLKHAWFEQDREALEQSLFLNKN